MLQMEGNKRTTIAMEQLSIPVILGTAREGRRSEAIAKWVLGQVEAAGLKTELIDVRELPSSISARVDQEGFDAGRFGKIMNEADGYIIVAPEYNHSIPGELKIFLDHFYNEYDRKVVGICGVSGGPWGGSRMIESLRQILGAVNVMVPKQTVQFTKAAKLFDEDGKMNSDMVEIYTKAVGGMIESVSWFASALKTARESSSGEHRS